MRANKISNGLLLVTIGVYVLLYNIGIIQWSIFPVLANLWPLFLISLGFQIIFNKREIAKIITLIITIILLFLYGFNTQYQWVPELYPSAIVIPMYEDSESLESESDDDTDSSLADDTESFSNILYSQNIKFRQNTKSASVNMTFEYNDLNLSKAKSNDSANVSISDSIKLDNLSYTSNDAQIDLYDQSSSSNSSQLFLSQEILWSMDISSARDINFDLSSLNFEKINIENSNSNLNLILNNDTTFEECELESKKIVLDISNCNKTVILNDANSINVAGKIIDESEFQIKGPDSSSLVFNFSGDCDVIVLNNIN